MESLLFREICEFKCTFFLALLHFYEPVTTCMRWVLITESSQYRRISVEATYIRRDSIWSQVSRPPTDTIYEYLIKHAVDNIDFKVKHKNERLYKASEFLTKLINSRLTGKHNYESFLEHSAGE